MEDVLLFGLLYIHLAGYFPKVWVSFHPKPNKRNTFKSLLKLNGGYKSYTLSVHPDIHYDLHGASVEDLLQAFHET